MVAFFAFATGYIIAVACLRILPPVAWNLFGAGGAFHAAGPWTPVPAGAALLLVFLGAGVGGGASRFIAPAASPRFFVGLAGLVLGLQLLRLFAFSRYAPALGISGSLVPRIGGLEVALPLAAALGVLAGAMVLRRHRRAA
jgi:hypothetical protein